MFFIPHRKISIIWYSMFDFIAAVLVWIIFSVIRKKLIGDTNFTGTLVVFNQSIFYGTLLLPFIWLFFYFLIGSYKSLYKKSRLNEFTNTFLVSVIGCILVFFVTVLNDTQHSTYYYYTAIFSYIALQFLVTLFFRWILLSIAKQQLLNGFVRFHALLAGDYSISEHLFEDTSSQLMRLGIYYKGFVSNEKNGLTQFLPHLGNLDQLEKVVKDFNIDIVVIAIKETARKEIELIINRLSEIDVDIKIVPDTLDIMAGSVSTTNVLSPVLADIKTGIIPEWQQNLKRLIDISVSIIGIAVFFPLMVYVAMRVRFSSTGPIFFKQERIGYKGSPFFIHKFRSMYVDAEKGGPALSSVNDPRITGFGRFMRKWRLDELPQLWNVLKGEMSLVGPRPERKYYINQLVKQAPYFNYLLKVKPGLTSWGMVQFGYAENVEQMIERMKYDLVYIENISLKLDLKIMLYTIRIIFKGKGQ